jgi:hypothetical protein
MSSGQIEVTGFGGDVRNDEKALLTIAEIDAVFVSEAYTISPVGLVPHIGEPRRLVCIKMNCAARRGDFTIKESVETFEALLISAQQGQSN